MSAIKILSTNDVEQKNGHCGKIRKMADGAARFYHLIVKDSERHYHKNTTEYYHVLNGHGQVRLDDKIYEIKKGDVITIPPGTVHNAIEMDETLEIMVIEVPPSINDVYIVRS